MRYRHLIPQFVEFVPETLEGGCLYVSMEHSVAIHLCACGCGRKTVTPLSPVDWRLCYNGRNVSLRPSIGNWAYPCRSHYWITDGAIQWADDMTDEEIDVLRGRARRTKKEFHGRGRHIESPLSVPPETTGRSKVTEATPWIRRTRVLLGLFKRKS